MKQLGPYGLEGLLCREESATYRAVHVPSGGRYFVHVLRAETGAFVLARIEREKELGRPVVGGYLDGVAVAVTPIFEGFAGFESWLGKEGGGEAFGLETGPAGRKLARMDSSPDVTDPRASFAKLVDRYSKSGSVPVARQLSVRQGAIASGLTTGSEARQVSVRMESEYSRVFAPVRALVGLGEAVPEEVRGGAPTLREFERLRHWAYAGWATAAGLGLLLLAALLGLKRG